MRRASCLVSPIPDHAFFEQPQFERLLGDNLLQVLRLAPELLDLIGRRGPRRVAGEPALTGLQKLLRPRVIHALGDTFAPATLAICGCLSRRSSLKITQSSFLTCEAWACRPIPKDEGDFLESKLI